MNMNMNIEQYAQALNILCTVQLNEEAVAGAVAEIKTSAEVERVEKLFNH